MLKALIPWSIGLFLFMQAGPVIGQTDEEIEDLFWNSVECQSARQVQAYFEVYPTGRYLAEAHACLEGQLGLERAGRILVQQGLAALNYSAGVADGLFGPATRRAIRAWQEAKELVATGYLTRAQADALMAQGREVVAEQQRQEEAHQQTQEATAQAQELPSRIRPDQTCVGQPKGTECWMELANQAGCYVWNGNLQGDETVMWTGECADGLAHGKGTLVWASGGKKEVLTMEGPYVDGKPHGPWIIRLADGRVLEGSLDGRVKQGSWVMRWADGSVMEGPYVDDKRHGRWTARRPDGSVEEGPYVDNMRHGRWTLRGGLGGLGAISERTYVNGEIQD